MSNARKSLTWKKTLIFSGVQRNCHWYWVECDVMIWPGARSTLIRLATCAFVAGLLIWPGLLATLLGLWMYLVGALVPVLISLYFGLPDFVQSILVEFADNQPRPHGTRYSRRRRTRRYQRRRAYRSRRRSIW